MPEYTCPVCTAPVVNYRPHGFACVTFMEGDGCESAGAANAVVALGHSIAAFCRRARVGELENDVAMGAYEIAMTNYRYGAREPESTRGDGGEKFRRALSELAAMARGDS